MALSGRRRHGEGREGFRVLRSYRRNPASVEATEVEAPGVGQMAGLDVAQRRENRLGATGELALPGGEHFLHRQALHIVLRAAQRAGDERKGATVRGALAVEIGTGRE